MANEGIIKKTTGEIAAKGKPKTLRDYIMSMQGVLRGYLALKAATI